MTCKIDRVLTPGGSVVFRVSGRIDGASFEVLQELTENEKTAKGRLVLGIELRNCPAYVREWISRVRERGLPE